MNALKQAREKQCISQLDMSVRLNVSVDTIRAWEQELRYIRVCDLLEVCRAYKLSMTDLLRYIKQTSRRGNIKCNI